MAATLAPFAPHGPDSAYWGDRAGWLIAASQHRDSDALERSNYRVIAADIMGAHPDDTAEETMSHWAVGWVGYLLVRPGSAAETAARRWAEKLDTYAVADEDDYAAVEDDDNHHDAGYCYADADSDCHVTDSLSRIIEGWRADGRRALEERYGTIANTRLLSTARYHGRLWHALTGRTSAEDGAQVLGL